MRNLLKFIAFGASLVAVPALSQVSVGGQTGVNVGVGVGVNPGGTVGTVTGTLDRTVNTVDRTVNHTANSALGSDLRVATSADLTAGAIVRDRRGNKIGTVQSVHADTAVVVKGGRTVNVPISRLYRGASGLVTNLTKAQINAMASANANANANVRN